MPAASTRLWFLDWLRIAAFALLVPYHVGMYYVSWGWHVKSPHAGPAIEPLLQLTGPWRLDLLFLVSGAATAFMLRRRVSTGSFLQLRARRLLLPLLFGVFVIVPPQSFFEVVQKYGYAGSFLDFMGLYVTGYHGFCAPGGRPCLILPTWNHLWFLPYLFLYTAVLCALLAWRGDLLDRAGAMLERRANGAWLFVLPIVWLALTRGLLRPIFPITHALVDDLFTHVQHGSMFVLGAALARAPAVWARFDAARWPALVLTLVAWAVRVGLDVPYGYSTQQWCAIVAALGFAHRHLDVDRPIRHELTLAVFPVYILHQTIIVLLTQAFARSGLAPIVEGPLLIVLTFGLCAAGYVLVRRIGWLRPWFGLPRRPAPTPAPAAQGVGP